MKRNVLLCVVGTTPQIVTETIYALIQKKIYLDEIIVITTSFGARKIKETLLDGRILNKLISDYRLPKTKFPPENIYIIKSDNDSELSDIRTTLENESAGEFICKIVKDLTQANNSILHCSLAGGRKTMGFYLGTALQLYGRRDDKLYHVLVNEEFENLADFFYPPPKPVDLTRKLPDGKEIILTTGKAKIELAELPFIRLREFHDFPNMNVSLKELIPYTQKEVDTARRLQPLKFIRGGELKIGDKEIRLSQSLWKFYLHFAKIKKEKCLHPQRLICKDCYDCFLPMKSDEKLNGLCDLIKHKDEGDVRTLITKVNNALKQQIQSPEIDFYIINSHGTHHKKRYGILIDKSKIIFSME